MPNIQGMKYSFVICSCNKHQDKCICILSRSDLAYCVANSTYSEIFYIQNTQYAKLKCNGNPLYSLSSLRIAVEASVMISLHDIFGSRNCSDLTNPSFSMFGDCKATSLLCLQFQRAVCSGCQFP